jgi:hypothetical protein
MKKLSLLSLVLALAACGGGSGGGSGGSGGSHGVPYARVAMTPEARASNKEITQMASEILVATDGGSPVVQRSGTASYQGKKYKSYRLDDVKFFTAENLNEGDETKPSFLKMELDRSGQINAIHMDVGGVASGRTVRDTTDTTVFQGPIFEYVQDNVYFVEDQSEVSTAEQRNDYKNDQHFGDGKWVQDAGKWKYIEYGDRALYRVVDNGSLEMADLNNLADRNNLTKNGHWNRIDERLDIKTYGAKIGTDAVSGEDIKLTYSDFGHFNPVYRTKNKDITTDEEIAAARAGELDRGEDLDKKRDDMAFAAKLAKEDYQMFAGGYAIKNGAVQNSLEPENNTTFKGKAIGRVYTSIESKKDGVDKSDDYLTDYGVPKDASSDPENHPEYRDVYSDEAGHDITKAFTTSEATMTISTEDGKIVQLLYMPFHSASDNSDKFYDITITQKGNKVEGVEFAAADENDIEAQYRKYDAFDTDSEGNFKYVEKANFHPGYYGVNEVSEAAGTAQLYSIQELSSEDKVKREYEVQAAYGMVKQ